MLAEISYDYREILSARLKDKLQIAAVIVFFRRVVDNFAVGVVLLVLRLLTDVPVNFALFYFYLVVVFVKVVDSLAVFVEFWYKFTCKTKLKAFVSVHIYRQIKLHKAQCFAKRIAEVRARRRKYCEYCSQ